MEQEQLFATETQNIEPKRRFGILAARMFLAEIKALLDSETILEEDFVQELRNAGL